jgi:hypothetical protein
MHQRTGSANLPLHGGHVPPWLSSRMAALGRVIAEAIVHEYGRDELLRRLAHPFWFQSFGAVMGMDWHSSGITTSVISALKRGLAPIQHELGFYVCGGKGAHSRRTPHELEEIGGRTGVWDRLGADEGLREQCSEARLAGSTSAESGGSRRTCLSGGRVKFARADPRVQRPRH